MCGIAAVFRPKAANGEPFIRAMLGRIRHRGFSHDEIWADDVIALGANRLEIVDPEGGRQPARNESGDIFAILNGEIYNRNSLSRLLTDRGHHFKSKCDTEVLVHAFEEWGLDMCDHLRGMFAFIIYDKQQERTLLARDPTGVKPLYVGSGLDDSFVAASEAKSLVGFASAVALLPPGHLHDGTKAFPYELSGEDEEPRDFNEAGIRLRELLMEAVSIRIPEGLPFAVFLSSGVDSSLILAIAARIRPDVIAISFGLPDSPEVRHAREFCQSLGIRHEVVELPFDDLISRYEQVIYHLESFEPNLVRASLITHALCERARQLGLRVALAGEGADEQFAGYEDFLQLPEGELERVLGTFFDDLHRTQLLRWDKMGMAHTVEVRTPFMDRRIVNFARTLSPSFKVAWHSGNTTPVSKAILRKAAMDFLPESIWNRIKIPMDDGVSAGGISEWERLLASYFESLPLPSIPEQICKKFAIANREELLNLSALLRYLPPEFISGTRITVRRKPII